MPVLGVPSFPGLSSRQGWRGGQGAGLPSPDLPAQPLCSPAPNPSFVTKDTSVCSAALTGRSPATGRRCRRRTRRARLGGGDGVAVF